MWCLALCVTVCMWLWNKGRGREGGGGRGVCVQSLMYVCLKELVEVVISHLPTLISAVSSASLLL